MKILFTVIISCFLSFQIIAQSVAISNSAATPDSSAILDIKSSNKGILLPRVHLTNSIDTNTIRKPAISLLVFNTNTNLPGGSGYYAWNGKSWDLLLSTANVFIKGKNRFTTIVDSIEREYWVHVPKNYDSTVKTPVVFMLHGTGGDGEEFYDKSGWKELGQEQNIITVFPSSQLLHVIDDSVAIWKTKWNAYPDVEWTFYPGASGKSDINFFRKVVLELKSKFNVDTSRIYLDGFSSGGQMAAKCAIEMGDVFAAIVSNAASFKLDTVYVPVRKLPVMFQLGNKDYGHGVHFLESPMSHFEASLNSTSFRNGRVARAYVRNFGLDSAYTVVGDTNYVRVATYTAPSGDTLNFFKFVYIKELGHKYPNGENFQPDYFETYNIEIIACKDHWAWFKKYRKP